VLLVTSLLATFVAACVLFVAVAHVRGWRWTGFAEKTLWDWLQLLVIPLALAMVAFGLSYLQSDRDHRREDRRAKTDRGIAADADREQALRVYLQQMSELLLQRHLQFATAGSTVNSVARTLTITVLRRLDGVRKGVVIQFLAEAGLIDDNRSISAPFATGKVSLYLANLRGLAFEDPPLFGRRINLTGADLSRARLAGVDLDANLSQAILRGADLARARLGGSLISADLTGADLSHARLGDVRLTNACVTRVRFVGTRFTRTRFGGMKGYGVNFSEADLSGADLTEAQLAGANLNAAAARPERSPRQQHPVQSKISDADVEEWCERH
jgi:uncharacterized protein YjbI with pentapeptide repeats